MKFHRITVTFDRVFDMLRTQGYQAPAHTLFGFETSTGNYHSIKIPGHPRLETGDTVTALLSEQGNWQTLRGWINHETREIAAPGITGSGIASAAMFIAAAFCLYWTRFTPHSLLAAPFLIGGFYWLRYAITAAAIRKELRKHSPVLPFTQKHPAAHINPPQSHRC